MENIYFEDVISKIKIIDMYFKEKYPDTSDEVRHLARLSKLTEELGELASEVLGVHKYLREDKQKKHSTESIESEWADVLNSLILVGLGLDIDMEKAFLNKYAVIQKRYNLVEEAQ